MAGKTISRICIIHMDAGICLYDTICPGDEHLWQRSPDEKQEDSESEDEYAMGIRFAVSGTKRERTQREELVSILKTFFLISRSIDDGNVFKACFQEPAENRQNNFAVKFTPHFGTLARPKKNVN